MKQKPSFLSKPYLLSTMMMRLAAARRLHRIFVERHDFTNPPANPKVVLDASFCQDSSDRGGTAVSFVTGLLGPARFYTTRCISNQIPEDQQPQDLKTIYCLHPPRDDDPDKCLRLVFSSVNPKDYFLATTQNTHLANSVNGLPIITLTDVQPAMAVFRPPSASQVRYADSNTTVAISERKSQDLNSLKNKKKNQKKKVRHAR